MALSELQMLQGIEERLFYANFDYASLLIASKGQQQREETGLH